MTALYRLVELSSGAIKIDGLDISKVGLKDLRSALAIIPQDPVCALLPLFVFDADEDLSCSFYVSHQKLSRS
jgi:ABC-type cobalamin/Fe3+-siderophores transport system ATPase subunit